MITYALEYEIRIERGKSDPDPDRIELYDVSSDEEAIVAGRKKLQELIPRYPGRKIEHPRVTKTTKTTLRYL